MGETLIIIVKFPDSLKLLVFVIYVATVNEVTEAEEREKMKTIKQYLVVK